jgi:hypothetical protein
MHVSVHGHASRRYASPVMLERRDWNIRQVLWKGAQNSNIAKIHQAGQLQAVIVDGPPNAFLKILVLYLFASTVHAYVALKNMSWSYLGVE